MSQSRTIARALTMRLPPLKRIGPVVFLRALSGGQGSLSETIYVHPYTKKNISPVSVLMIDNAVNGCWTNLIETKAYAPGQMDLAGLDLNDGKNAQTSFEVSVSSERTGNGLS